MSGSRKPGEHGLTLSATQAALETGENATSLRLAVQSVQAIGGSEVVKKLTGTKLATKAEMTSLTRLQKEYPDVARRLLAGAAAGRNVSAQATLGGLTKEANDTKRKKKLELTLRDRDGAMVWAAKEMKRAARIVERVRREFEAAEVKSGLADLARIHRSAVEFADRASMHQFAVK